MKAKTFQLRGATGGGSGGGVSINSGCPHCGNVVLVSVGCINCGYKPSILI